MEWATNNKRSPTTAADVFGALLRSTVHNGHALKTKRDERKRGEEVDDYLQKKAVVSPWTYKKRLGAPGAVIHQLAAGPAVLHPCPATHSAAVSAANCIRRRFPAGTPCLHHCDSFAQTSAKSKENNNNGDEVVDRVFELELFGQIDFLKHVFRF